MCLPKLRVMLTIVACVLAVLSARAEEPRLVYATKIWDEGAHNAFTDLIRFKGRWFCTFREAAGHVRGDGKIRVIRSDDGEVWESTALLEEAGIDLRDPKLSVTPGNRLMIVAGGSVYRDGTLVGRQPRVAFSNDGTTWTAPQRVLEEGHWLWRVTWHNGKTYGVSYVAGQPLQLVVSDDGVTYSKITEFDIDGRPNETTLRFLDDDTMVALVRREEESQNGYIGTSQPPYTEWSWNETGYRLGGPNFIVLPDGEMWAGSRYYPGGAKTVLARMTTESYEPVATLPSGGDTSYPGLVWHDDVLWMSYYASHEGKTSIYLAKFVFTPPLPDTSSEDVDAKHVTVYHEPGRFGGWPANFGIWSWDNEILVGFARGYYKDLGDRHHIDRNRPEEHLLARSHDGGETWTLEFPFRAGELVARGDSLHGTETPGLEIPPLKESPGGVNFEGRDFAMTLRMDDIHAGTSRWSYSYDRGRTWDGPFQLPDFGARGTAARTDYLVNDTHDAFIFITVAKENGREGRPICARTTDGGRTWNLISYIDEEPEGFSIMPASVRLSASEILVHVRKRKGPKRWIAAYLSQDNGETWEHLNDPVPDAAIGNPPSLIKLEDGRLCLVYGFRGEPYSIRAKLSSDNGRTWGPDLMLRTDGLSRDVGYCRSVQRPDGKIVSLYYFCDPLTGPERYIGATIWSPPAP